MGCFQYSRDVVHEVTDPAENMMVAEEPPIFPRAFENKIRVDRADNGSGNFNAAAFEYRDLVGDPFEASLANAQGWQDLDQDPAVFSCR